VQINLNDAISLHHYILLASEAAITGYQKECCCLSALKTYENCFIHILNSTTRSSGPQRMLLNQQLTSKDGFGCKTTIKSLYASILRVLNLRLA
jgi:hypothetical protein